jgi:hypothetical protein
MPTRSPRPWRTREILPRCEQSCTHRRGEGSWGALLNERQLTTA